MGEIAPSVLFLKNNNLKSHLKLDIEHYKLNLKTKKNFSLKPTSSTTVQNTKGISLDINLTV